jgi:oligopeptidase A
MALMNSLLSNFFPERPLGLPQFDRFDASEVEPAIAQLLSEFEQILDVALKSEISDAKTGYTHVCLAIEQAQDQLECAFSTVQHLHRVCSSEALRQAYAPALEAVSAFQAKLMQNAAYFAALERIHNASDFHALSKAEQACVRQLLRDLKLGGVALADMERAEFREIVQALSQLNTDFEEALMDASEHWQHLIENVDHLEGVPTDALARFETAAKAKGLSGYLLSLDYPSYAAVMNYCANRPLRALVYQAYLTRASELESPASSLGGEQRQRAAKSDSSKSADNGPRIEKMLALKTQAAKLLGFESSAHESLATKMAADPAEVFTFLNQLLARARLAADQEMVALRAFAAAELDLSDLQPWDLNFVSEKYKSKTLGFDDNALRAYFEFEHVLVGMFEIIQRVFGITVQKANTSAWHADVRFFEIFRGDQKIAAFYLDAFARSKKRSGAWMDVCRTQRRVADKHRIPVAYLVCNFAPPNDVHPSLLSHTDVCTLFHEFGHGLHHMLSKVCTPIVGGISGVEWDAVELPSQFLENFCWQKPALERLAKHHRSGAAMPTDLQTALLSSRGFHSGLFLVRQLEFALFDFNIHAMNPAPSFSQTMDVLQKVRERTAVLQAPSWNRFAQSFSHIFGGGYSAGYYSYLWAEVLSADAFAPFVSDAFDRQAGQKFVDEVLAVGATRAAMESFIAYRGRAPSQTALLQSYGLSNP